jgi:hypothetical protein
VTDGNESGGSGTTPRPHSKRLAELLLQDKCTTARYPGPDSRWPMSRHGVRHGEVVTVELAGHTAYLVDLPSRRARWVLDRLGIPRQWNPDARCWTCPAKRIQELSRFLGSLGDAVVVVPREVDR